MENNNSKIQFGDHFSIKGQGYFECIGLDEGFIWYSTDPYSEAISAEHMDCEKITMHPKILNFAKEMQKQIDINTELGKTTWETWYNIKEILVDFEYHKSKAIMALKEDNIGALREYLADCGNILMFLGNACGMYTTYEDSKPVFQMVSPLFTETTIDKAIIRNNIDKI